MFSVDCGNLLNVNCKLKCDYDGKIKDDEMDEECSAHGEVS
jgi:hypothetical protein